MAKIYLGATLIADNIPDPEWSIHGVSRALADRMPRAEYRRVFRGRGITVTGDGENCLALIETRNDDGSRGPTYTIAGKLPECAIRALLERD